MIRSRRSARCPRFACFPFCSPHYSCPRFLCRPAVAADSAPASRPAKSLPRLLVLTDIGGDPDDQQAMVRLMCYANEFEIEGLIASAAGTPGELKEHVTKPEKIREIVEAYDKVRPNLPEARRRISTCQRPSGKDQVRQPAARQGRGRRREGHRRLALDHLVRRSRRPPPVNIAIWGGQTDLAQALWRVRADRGPP